MEEYLVEIIAYAEDQLDGIVHELNEPTGALRIFEVLEIEINKLSQLPQRIVLVEEEPWHSEGIHKLIVKSFVVCFWIDESNMTVQITRIFYTKKEQVNHLLKMNRK